MADTNVVVDYGMGNAASICNMLARLGHTFVTTDDSATIASASRIILPGVGAFDEAAYELSRRDLRVPILEAATLGTPILGICLGMQLLVDGSEEGQLPGLGLIPGLCRRLPTASHGQPLLVPHMGWNTLHDCPAGVSLPSIAGPERRYYFVHSYVVETESPSSVMARSTYGIEFTAAVCAGSVMGVQFHPEKSHRHGMALMNDFMKVPVQVGRT